MQPMFKILPGFLAETNILNGGDEITSEGGDDYLIGDDIWGCNMIDLTKFSRLSAIPGRLWTTSLWI